MNNVHNFYDYLYHDIKVSRVKLKRFLKTIQILNWALRSRGRLAVLLHRLAHHSYKSKWGFMYGFYTRLSQFLCSVEIDPYAQIGPGFKIAHGGAIVLGGDIVAGSNFSIRQGITIGGNLGKRDEQSRRFPIFGDNVLIGAGACVLGPVKIGSNVVIGANSIVTFDVPDDSVVGPLPTTFIKKSGEKVPLEAQPGPVGREFKQIHIRLAELEAEIKSLRDSSGKS
ncbi:MAG: serine O-acetyltransferase [Planctomycetota bacterium]|jgi:serine O-acetyltransferase